MAKKSAIQKDLRIRRLVELKSARRAELRSKARNPELDAMTRMEARWKLAEMPRNSSRVRIHNRCALTGRPHGYYRKFGLSRIALRDLASAGMLPGVTKASW